MSEYIGVISWNVKGDLRGSASASERVNNLRHALAHLSALKDCPVHFLCFQETCGSNGALEEALKKEGYTCYGALHEGNQAGMHYLFSLHPKADFVFDGVPEQCLFKYISATGSPVRYPAVAKLVRRKDGKKVALLTFHAPRDGALQEGLERCSELAVNTVKSNKFSQVFVAGDLNISEEATIYVPKLGKSVPFLKHIFPGFVGWSNNLDHVMCWPDVGLRKIFGWNFETSSDHALVYTRFQVN